MSGDWSRRDVLPGLLAATLAAGRAAAQDGAGRGGGPAPRVLVAGATGRLGLLVVRALQARGVTVLALARDAARARAALPSGAVLVTGDLREPEAFGAALQDVDTIVFAATATAGGSGANTPQNVDYGGVAGLLRVLGPRRLRQFLLVSSASVTQRLHPHNLWNDILLWKLRGEDLLRASGQPYTIVRPCGLRGYPGGARTIQLTQGDRFAFGYVIAREDAARVCAAAVGSGAALGKTFEAYNDDAAPVDLERQFGALQSDVTPQPGATPRPGSA